MSRILQSVLTNETRLRSALNELERASTLTKTVGDSYVMEATIGLDKMSLERKTGKGKQTLLLRVCKSVARRLHDERLKWNLEMREALEERKRLQHDIYKSESSLTEWSREKGKSTPKVTLRNESRMRFWVVRTRRNLWRTMALSAHRSIAI